MDARRRQVRAPPTLELHEIDTEALPAVVEQAPSRAIRHIAMRDRMRQRAGPRNRFEQWNRRSGKALGGLVVAVQASRGCSFIM